MRRVREPVRVLAVCLVALGTMSSLAGCAVGGSEPAASAPTSSPSARGSGASVPPTPAHVGATAPSQRVSFLPRALVLGEDRAQVRPAATSDGQLQVPEEVQHLGWWDGSAAVGDPYGSVVVAGHIDSATEGLGFFARLPSVAVGDVVQVQGRSGGSGYHLDYRVRRIARVDKGALATGSDAFDQAGSARLVLITCTGDYLPDQGGYQQNLVVTATPMGRPRLTR